MFYKTLDTASIGHRGVALTASVPLAAQLGFAGIWLDAGRDFVGNPQDVKGLLANHQLLPAGFALPLEFRASQEIFQAGLDKLPSRAAFAREIGISRCVTWIVPGHDQLTFNENFDLHQGRLSQAAEILQGEGIWLGLEFVAPLSAREHTRYPFIHTLAGVMTLCEAIGTGNCGVLLDAWHWHLAGLTFADITQFSNPRQIVCVHVSDAPVNTPDALQNDLVRRLPGTTGVINLPSFFAGLQFVGYDGPVVVEPFEAFLGKVPVKDAAIITKRQLDLVWPA